MADVGNLKTRISLDSAQFEQSMAGVNRQLKSLKQEQKAVTSSGTGFARNVTELKSKSDVLNRTLQVQKTRVEELRRRYEQSRQATGDNTKETQEASAEYQKAAAEMRKTENRLEGVTAELERQTNPWNQLSREMDTAGQRMQTIGRQTTAVGRGLTMGVTTPILGAGAAALTAGINFEEGMSKVQAVSGATGSDFEQLEEQAKELGSTTRYSASEAAGGMEFLARAGFEANEVVSAMPGLLDLAASENMQLSRAADIASNILQGFNMQADEAGKVSDVLARGASTANTSVEQLGGAMQYAAPVASTLGLSMEEMTAAVGFMSDAGIQGQRAGRQLRQGMLRLSDPTKEAASLIEDLGIQVFDAEGNMKSMPKVVKELNSGFGDMDSEARTAALSVLFGAESVAGWSTVLDRGAGELGSYTKELENSEGAASDMASTMEDNAKGSLREFKSALEGAGIEISKHLLPAFTDIVEDGTELVRKFSELDESTQKNIIKMAGLAAAIGPAAIVLGNMTTAIGGLMRAGSGLVGLLGRAGGAGLIGRIGLLGMSGPVGLAVGGIAALGGVVYALTRDSEDMNDVNWDVVEGMQKEVEETDNLIGRFEELERKNKLSSDEMLRYMDILDELSQTNSKQEIEKLKNEQEKLLEKSGLTNDEMQEFLDLNDKVIEKAPTTKKAISEEGNAYAENLSALKELNEEKRKEMLITAERELEKALENESSLMKEQKELVSDIKRLDQEIMENKDKRIEKDAEIKEAQQGLKDIQGELLELEGQSGSEAAAKRAQLKEQEKNQKLLVEGLKSEKEQLEVVQDKLIAKFQKKNDDLELTRDEIAEMDKLKWDYEELILAQAGINSEKGKGLEKIDTTISKLEEEKQKLKDQTPVSQRNTGEYQDQVDEINNQIGKLEGARSKLEEVNDLAGQTVYDKEVNLSVDPTAAAVDRALGQTVYKKIKADVQGNTFAQYGLSYTPGLATGTDYHKGGLALTGEEGPELARSGNRWSMLDFGLHDLPRGTQVFTHDESKKIISALNNMPGYASGASPAGEADRIANQLQPTGTTGDINQYITIHSPQPTSPAENARKIKQASRQLAMEWG